MVQTFQVILCTFPWIVLINLFNQLLFNNNCFVVFECTRKYVANNKSDRNLVNRKKYYFPWKETAVRLNIRTPHQKSPDRSCQHHRRCYGLVRNSWSEKNRRFLKHVLRECRRLGRFGSGFFPENTGGLVNRFYQLAECIFRVCFG